MMNSIRFLSLALAASVSLAASAASAVEVKQKGGTAYSGREGPWVLARASYQNGQRACIGANLHQRDKAPVFRIIHMTGGKENWMQVQFDAITAQPPNAEVTLEIGDERFTLVRQPDGPDTGFNPTTTQDLVEIVLYLRNREVQKDKRFWIEDASGRRYRFDARKTERMLEKLEELCTTE